MPEMVEHVVGKSKAGSAIHSTAYGAHQHNSMPGVSQMEQRKIEKTPHLAPYTPPHKELELLMG